MKQPNYHIKPYQILKRMTADHRPPTANTASINVFATVNGQPSAVQNTKENLNE